MAGYEDRQMFGAYYLTESGETLCSFYPRHIFNQGVIGDKYLIFVLLSELSLADETNKKVESADMPVGECDYFFENYETALDNLQPYAQAVVDYDASQGKDQMDIVGDRAFLLIPEFVGKTFDEVCALYPIEYTEVTNDDGSSINIGNIWANSNEDTIV